MKIYSDKNNIYDAVDALVGYGIIAIEGTKTPATAYSRRVLKCIKVYSEIDAHIGFQDNLKYNGYLYYIVDYNRFSMLDSEIEKIMNKIDKLKFTS